MKRANNKIQNGFTLVELLTTLAVIGILLSLLIPALTAVQKAAVNIKQKGQFHAIELGLEAFQNDYGDYPPSEWLPATYGPYSASQRLAEALVGWDGFGWHQDSTFNAIANFNLYIGYGNPDLDVTKLNLPIAQANLTMRKGPYLEMEKANAMIPNAVGLVNSYVLVDMYKISKNTVTGKMTGLPILYYKANRMKPDHSFVNMTTSTYNVDDSAGLITAIQAAGFTHNLAANGGKELFYTMTQNPDSVLTPRPYRAETFILQSAGPDGNYGTNDDVFNFDSEK